MNKDTQNVVDDLIANTQTARQQNAFIKTMSPHEPGELVPAKAHHAGFEMPVDSIARIVAVAAVVAFLCGSYIILMGADPLTVRSALGL